MRHIAILAVLAGWPTAPAWADMPYIGLGAAAEMVDLPGTGVANSDGSQGGPFVGYGYDLGEQAVVYVAGEVNYAFSDPKNGVRDQDDGGLGLGVILGFHASAMLDIYASVGIYAGAGVQDEDVTVGIVDDSYSGLRLGLGTSIEVIDSYRMRIEYSQTDYDFGALSTQANQQSVSIGLLHQF